MTAHGDVKRLEQRAYRHTLEDGLTDLFMAAVLLFASGVLLKPEMLALLGVLVLFVPAVVQKLKHRFTYPRTGYVELPQESPGRLAGGMFGYMGGALIVMACLLWFAGQVSNPTAWRKWAPLLAAVMVGGGIHHAATRSGLRRYYVFQVISLLTAVTISLTNSGDTYAGVSSYCLLMSMTALVMGAVTFAQFRRRYPVSAGEGATDDEQ